MISPLPLYMAMGEFSEKPAEGRKTGNVAPPCCGNCTHRAGGWCAAQKKSRQASDKWCWRYQRNHCK